MVWRLRGACQRGEESRLCCGVQGGICGLPDKSGLADRPPTANLARVSADLCLILETSTARGSAAVADERGGALLDERTFESDRNHNAAMFGPLEKMLASGVAERITRVLVGSGPGSYSGTRVGIAVAQGIAIARSCPAIAIPSLVAVADPAAKSLAIGDARRGHGWWVRINGRRMAASAPELGDFSDLEAAVRAAEGEGRRIFTFEDPRAFGFSETIHREAPHAAALWQAWCEAPADLREAWAAAPPQPVYLKPPHITPAKRAWLQVD